MPKTFGRRYIIADLLASNSQQYLKIHGGRIDGETNMNLPLIHAISNTMNTGLIIHVDAS